MRWGPTAQTDRDTDLVIDESQDFGTPLPLMLEPTPTQTDPIGEKRISGRYTAADDDAQSDDQSIAWVDWSLGMNFGRIDRIGRGGYSYGIGVDARDPRRLMPAGKLTDLTMPGASSNPHHAPIRGFQQYGSNVYIVTGVDAPTGASDPAIASAGSSDVWRIFNSGDFVTIVGRYPSDTPPYFCGRSILQYRGYLYIGGYNGMLRRKLTVFGDPDQGPGDDAVPGDGTAFTGYSFQRVYLAKQHWKVAGISDYYLLANDTEQTFVYTTADPTVAGNWSSPTGVIQGDTNISTYLGDTTYQIRSVAYSNGRIYWVKGDGVYDSDSSGYTPNITPYVGDIQSDDNGLCSYYHDGYVYFATASGLQRIGTTDRIRVDVPEYVHPGFGRPVDGPIYGIPTAITSVDGWLVVALWNGRESFIIYGKDPSKLGVDIPVPLIWHGAMAHFPGAKITALGKARMPTEPKLLIGQWNPTTLRAQVTTMDLPKAASPYQAWKSDEDYLFQTRWRIYFTGEDLLLPNIRKALLRGDITSENVTPSRKIEVYTSFDGTTYAEKTSAGDPYYTLTPPISGTYTISIFGYGTTATLAYDATVATVRSELETLVGSTHVSVSMQGERSFRIALVDLEATAIPSVTDQASLAYHLLGTALTSPRQAYVPSSQTPTAVTLSVRVDGAGTETEPSIMTSLRDRISLIEDQLEEKEYTVRIGQGVANRFGISMHEQDPVAAMARLIALMNRGAVWMIDERGRSVSVKIRSGLKYEQVEVDGGWYFRVTFRVKVQRQPFYWGAGSVWSDAYSWSS